VAPAFHPSTVAGSEGGPGDEPPAGPRPADPGPPDAEETARPATRGLFD
jgi:hypothetical protein